MEGRVLNSLFFINTCSFAAILLTLILKTMIKRQRFAEIDKEVKDCIQQTLNNLKAKSPENYVLFLADGEYKKEYDNLQTTFSPFVIDNRIDRYKDHTRLTFLFNFLTTFYKFPTSQNSTDDNEQRIHMELMSYSHIWESKPFLKKLHRLSHLDNNEDYNWSVIVPDMGKHDFIRKGIRETLEANNNPLAMVIKKGFHTSLRNAFAHSDYSFDTMNGNKRIYLDNYTGQAWELQEISFDDWSERFVYSSLLSFHLLDLTHKNRIALVTDFGTDTFTIKHPSKSDILNYINITYTQKHDSFTCY